MNGINAGAILCLDSATQYTGYSVYTKGEITPPVYSLTHYGNIKVHRDEDVVMRCLEMSSKVSKLIHDLKPGQLIVEYPYFQGGTKGEAASRSGGTLSLAYLCGRISVCWEYYIAKVMRDTGIELPLTSFVKYSEWAGQTNKKITCRRLKEKFNLDANPESIDNNWSDAVMMGHWHVEHNLHCTSMNGGAKEVSL